MTITHANMSDEDRDVDIESDAEKRAHHNALERKRRDHIKDSFSGLRDSIPSLQGEKASRAQILKKAADYIQFMRRKNSSHQQDIDDLKRQNQLLETQTIKLQRQRSAMNKMKPHSQIKYSEAFMPDTSPSSSNDQPTSSSVRSLEKAKSMGTFTPAGVMDTASLITNPKGDVVSAFDGGSGSESSDSESSSQSRRKKMKTGSPTTSSSGT